MDNQELVREYNRAISSEDYLGAAYYLEKLSKPKECYKCLIYKREIMKLQKLASMYEEYLKNNNLEKAIEIMGEIARFKTRTIDPDWIDIIKEFNRRLSNG